MGGQPQHQTQKKAHSPDFLMDVVRDGSNSFTRYASH